MFNPPLPRFNTEAISRLGFGVVNKLFLQLGSIHAPPAFDAIPRNPEASSPRSKNGHSQQSQTGLRLTAIVEIVTGDIARIGILALVFLYIYRLKKKKSTKAEQSDGSERQGLSNDTNIISFLARTQTPSAGLFRFSNGSMLFKSCLGWCPRTVPPSTPLPPPGAPPRRCSGTSDRSISGRFAWYGPSRQAVGTSRDHSVAATTVPPPTRIDECSFVAEETRKIFKSFDSNGDGKISVRQRPHGPRTQS
ncbi:hypothetical protein ACFX2I_011903 [Malus domestica]